MARPVRTSNLLKEAAADHENLECRTAADQAAELNETGQVGLLRLAEVSQNKA